MGAVHFSIDPGLIETLKQVIPLQVFVETGTFEGRSAELVRPFFEKIYTVELSEQYYRKACEKFAGDPGVELFQGDSAHALAALAPKLAHVPVLYWLDAHWCVAEQTAGEKSQCPMLRELEAIGHLNDQSAIIIDDARLFLTTPPEPHEISDWPEFDAIVRALFGMSSGHSLSVLNDTILFVPKAAVSNLRDYSRRHATDLLSVFDQARGYQEQLASANEKQEVIEAQEEELKTIREALRLALSKNLKSRIINKVRKNYWMKLGVLRQYEPRKMRAEKFPAPTHPPGDLPSIAIVTPSYMQGRFLERTMQSVLSQEYPRLQYVVQDGGSTDGSVEVIKRHASKLAYWESARDKGQSDAVKRGFEKCNSDIMAWLNSDDMFMPGSLRYVAEYFAAHPEVDAVYGHRMVIDENDNEIGRWVLPRHKWRILKWVDFVPQETLFWRRSLWEKTGGVDPSFQFALDWDLLLKFEKAGAEVVRLPYFLGCFRTHAAQKTLAEMVNSHGEKEMARIRKGLHGRDVTGPELAHYAEGFCLQGIKTSILLSLGIRA